MPLRPKGKPHDQMTLPRASSYLERITVNNLSIQCTESWGPTLEQKLIRNQGKSSSSTLPAIPGTEVVPPRQRSCWPALCWGRGLETLMASECMCQGRSPELLFGLPHLVE